MVVPVLGGRIGTALVMMIVTSHRRVFVAMLRILVVMILRILIAVFVLMALRADGYWDHGAQRKRGQG